MPVFEDLLPKKRHNRILMDLLYDLAYWHALAKLRLHTQSSLERLSHAVELLGISMKSFLRKVCTAFSARELPRESDARIRRESKSGSAPVSGRKVRKFNVPSTIKYHSLGDYRPSIQDYGTSDGFSTQIVRVPLYTPRPICSLSYRVNLSIAGSRNYTNVLTNARRL
jgi:hypothetical protein